jgi:hypothetical protein
VLHASIRCLDTLRSIFEGYFRIELGIERDAEGRPVFPEHGSKLRSARHRVGIVERLVYPALGKYPIGEIRRTDLIRMLDKIAESNSEVMSDHVLAIVRKLMNWQRAARMNSACRLCLAWLAPSLASVRATASYRTTSFAPSGARPRRMADCGARSCAFC